MCKCFPYRHFLCGCRVTSMQDPNGELMFYFRVVCDAGSQKVHTMDDMDKMMESVLIEERKRIGLDIRHGNV